MAGRNHATAPFRHFGIDYLGKIVTKRWRTRVKAARLSVEAD
jgi:hypothetical protein